jgi:hypothetical protein
MVEIYGWNIQENGAPGKGTRFVITIPKTNKTGQPIYEIQTVTIINEESFLPLIRNIQKDNVDY